MKRSFTKKKLLCAMSLVFALVVIFIAVPAMPVSAAVGGTFVVNSGTDALGAPVSINANMTFKILTEPATAGGLGTVQVGNDEKSVADSTAGTVVIPTIVSSGGKSYTVTSIGESSFNQCEHITEVIIPNTVTSIGYSAFYNCEALGTITIPDSVTIIGNRAFEGCTAITSIIIPESVTSIGESAFFNCSEITNINIPKNVMSIGEHAFVRCSKLTAITVNTDNPNFLAVDGVLFDKNITKLISYPNSKGSSYIVPSTVKTIGSYSFYYCQNLTSITLSDAVTTIEKFAFDGSALASIDLKNVETIGDEAFEGTPLSSITLPSSLNSIGKNVFRNTNLTSLTVDAGNTNFSAVDNVLFDETNKTLIYYPKSNPATYIVPDRITSIGSSAFYNNTTLSSIDLNNVTDIGDYAFYGNSALTTIDLQNVTNSIGAFAFRGAGLTEVEIAEGIKTIATSTFYSCSNLAKVTLPNSVTTIDLYAFFNNSSLTTIDLKNVTTIGREAFGRTALTAIDLKNVTTVGISAFIECSDLATVDMRNVTTIENRAFDDCEKLESIAIPKTVTTIGDDAFVRCDALNSVYFDGSNGGGLTAGIATIPDNAGMVIYYNADASGWRNPVQIDGASITPIPIKFSYGPTQFTYDGSMKTVDVTGISINNGPSLSASEYIVSDNTATAEGTHRFTVSNVPTGGVHFVHSNFFTIGNFPSTNTATTPPPQAISPLTGVYNK